MLDIRFAKAWSQFAWAIYSLMGLISAYLFSWILIATTDFAYPWLHDSMDITAHSNLYGPQNKYKKGFEHTNRDERIRLFHEINVAVHSNGDGLEDIEYKTPSGQRIDTLLRKPEIIHLQDVAHLINVSAMVGVTSFICWLFVTIYCVKKHVHLPSLKKQTLMILSLVVLSTIVILIIGPTEVFYAFHRWLFPDGHQWFFYYQESLMTILMKAPFLFGWIAIILTLIALTIFVVLATAASFINRHQMHNSVQAIHS